MTGAISSHTGDSPVDTASGPSSSTTVQLRGSVTMPVVGMGLYLVDPADMTPVVHTALDRGYRLFDTASMYGNGGNEAGLGAALGSSGIAREEVFLTSKAWNDEQGSGPVRDALQRSLERLRTDHLDLYLIHWPAPGQGQFIQTWETLLELQREGLIRAAGVANFEADHIEQLIEATATAPAVNQIEVHPHLQQTPLLAYNASVGTATQAWSPLARGGAILRDRTIADIAAAHRRTPGQVILRWHLQRGTSITPKSAKPERISDNIDLFTFALDDAEMGAIANLERGHRTGPDPRTFPQN